MYGFERNEFLIEVQGERDSAIYLSPFNKSPYRLYPLSNQVLLFKLDLLFRVALTRNYPGPFYVHQEKGFVLFFNYLTPIGITPVSQALIHNSKILKSSEKLTFKKLI